MLGRVGEAVMAAAEKPAVSRSESDCRDEKSEAERSSKGLGLRGTGDGSIGCWRGGVEVVMAAKEREDISSPKQDSGGINSGDAMATSGGLARVCA